MVPIKVNIYETVEVSDEARVRLAAVLDGTGSKKRQATRDEIKDFIWANGREWEDRLGSAYDGSSSQAEPDDDDLI